MTPAYTPRFERSEKSLVDEMVSQGSEERLKRFGPDMSPMTNTNMRKTYIQRKEDHGRYLIPTSAMYDRQIGGMTFPSWLGSMPTLPPSPNDPLPPRQFAPQYHQEQPTSDVATNRGHTIHQRGVPLSRPRDNQQNQEFHQHREHQVVHLQEGMTPTFTSGPFGDGLTASIHPLRPKGTVSPGCMTQIPTQSRKEINGIQRFHHSDSLENDKIASQISSLEEFILPRRIPFGFPENQVVLQGGSGVEVVDEGGEGEGELVEGSLNTAYSDFAFDVRNENDQKTQTEKKKRNRPQRDYTEQKADSESVDHSMREYLLLDEDLEQDPEDEGVSRRAIDHAKYGEEMWTVGGTVNMSPEASISGKTEYSGSCYEVSKSREEIVDKYDPVGGNPDCIEIATSLPSTPIRGAPTQARVPPHPSSRSRRYLHTSSPVTAPAHVCSIISAAPTRTFLKRDNSFLLGESSATAATASSPSSHSFFGISTIRGESTSSPSQTSHPSSDSFHYMPAMKKHRLFPELGMNDSSELGSNEF